MALRYTRCKTLATLMLIVRSDKQTLAVTDHDRQLTFEGRTYRPIIFGALSADRREGALRTGDQEAAGVIDGIQIEADEVDAQNYVGAEVRQVIIDWRNTAIVYARHKRWIRRMTRTGSAFTATLEGRAQQLQRPNGGRFGGFFTTKCQYRLGGPFCKKDISDWIEFSVTDSGNATGVAFDSLQDSTQAWTVNGYQSTASEQFYIVLRPNSVTPTINAGAGQIRKILSNSATTVQLDEPLTTLPAQTIGYRLGRGYTVNTVTRGRYEFTMNSMTANTDQFFRDGTVLWTTGPNIGRVFPIADYRSSDRKIVLLTPTPFDIVAGHRAIIIVGCDGLIGTCRDKFNNLANFGGDAFAPSAQSIVAPPEIA